MTNDEKKTLLQQRYAELDDESLCALERHKLTEQARELFDAELARRGLDLAAYEARHGDSLYRSRTALRQRQWRGVGLKAILAGVIFSRIILARIIFASVILAGVILASVILTGITAIA